MRVHLNVTPSRTNTWQQQYHTRRHLRVPAPYAHKAECTAILFQHSTLHACNRQGMRPQALLGLTIALALSQHAVVCGAPLGTS